MKKWICLLAIVAMASCNKDEQESLSPKTPEELLTRQEWFILTAGFDDNGNGIVDQTENTVQDCQKDNTITYNLNGTGISRDNQLICGGPPTTTFTWRLLNNNTELEVSSQLMKILSITETNLALRALLPSIPTPFIITYRH